MNCVWRTVVASLITTNALTLPAFAHEAPLTKDSPKLLYAQGETSRSVPVDGVRLTFTFTTESGSFLEADKVRQGIGEHIRQQLASLQGPKLSLAYGWNLIRQGKLATEGSGRRLEHTLSVELEAIPPGNLHALVAEAVDRCVQVHKKLELERIEVYLTPAKEQELKAALFKEASAAALANAQGIAEGSGAKLSGARFLVANTALPQSVLQEGGLRGVEALASQALTKSFSLQKSFKVRTEVPDQLEVSVNVVGVFELL